MQLHYINVSIQCLHCRAGGNLFIDILLFFQKKHYFALVSKQSTSKINKFQQNLLWSSHQSDHSPHPLIYTLTRGTWFPLNFIQVFDDSHNLPFLLASCTKKPMSCTSWCAFIQLFNLACTMVVSCRLQPWFVWNSMGLPSLLTIYVLMSLLGFHNHSCNLSVWNANAPRNSI